MNITNTPKVNAQQSGSWNVGLVGTPIVKIDPNANAVSVTPAGQKLVFDSGFISPPNAAFTDIPVNVQSYSKIRVFGFNSSNANGDVITNSSLPGAVLVPLDSFSLSPGHRFTQLYEVVGSTLLLRVASCNGCIIRLWVYGS